MKKKEQPDSFRIMVADDHAMFRAGLVKLIQEQPSLQVVAEAGSGDELIEFLNQKECDLVILDIGMPGLDGLNALALIKKIHRRVRVLMLTMHRSAAYFKKAVSKGADGYLLKEDAFERLVWAVQEIRAGRKAFSPILTAEIMESIAEDPVEEGALSLLSQREKEILSCVARGMTSKAIGQELDLSPRTVENHRARILEKLGLPNNAALIRFAVSKKLL